MCHLAKLFLSKSDGMGDCWMNVNDLTNSLILFFSSFLLKERSRGRDVDGIHADSCGGHGLQAARRHRRLEGVAVGVVQAVDGQGLRKLHRQRLLRPRQPVQRWKFLNRIHLNT